MLPLRPALPSHARGFRIYQVPPLQPLRWLLRGWVDLMADPVPGLLHGAAAAAFGALLILLARDRFWLLGGAFSGFLLVAPLMATGLYAVSRAREQGLPAGLGCGSAPDQPRSNWGRRRRRPEYTSLQRSREACRLAS